jgi:hypothetical protein
MKLTTLRSVADNLRSEIAGFEPCHWHHYLKTHQRHRIEPSGTEWLWIPADDTRTGAFSFSPSRPVGPQPERPGVRP